MKAIVVLLAILAALKVGVREQLFRTSSQDVIVAAYRERAADACQREPKSQVLGIETKGWSKASEARVAIGKNDVGVFLWQVDDELWNARFRNPYLYLSTTARTGKFGCEYDIVKGAASVFRL
jgi:hypothetical protein